MRGMFGLSTRELWLAAALVGCIAVFAALSPVFPTVANATTILRNSTELFLVGLGMTLLLGVGAIDVSVGVAMGLAAILVGRLLQGSAGAVVAGLAGPVAGGFVGLLTAVVVVLGRIPPIVATLGLFGVYRAAIFLTLGGSWLSGLPTDLTAALGARLFGLPVALPSVIAVYLVVFVLVRLTPFGPHLLASGASETRARLSGVPVRRVQFTAFAISGVLTGLAASFYIATYRNVAMTVGGTLALEAIAAVVLGGTAITGGRLSLVGTFLGVLLLRTLQNGLLLVGVPSLWQPVVTGVLLITVLGADAVQGRIGPSRWGASLRSRVSAGRLLSR